VAEKAGGIDVSFNAVRFTGGQCFKTTKRPSLDSAPC
jgi:hypothetical protein